MSTKVECQVCFDNVKSDNSLTCCFCENVLCKNCITNWMTEKKAFTCPLCNKLFTRHFIVSHFGKAFMRKFNVVEKEMLLVREKLMIPEYSKFLHIPEQIEQRKKELATVHTEYMEYRKMNIKELNENDELQNLLGENFKKRDLERFYIRQETIIKDDISALENIIINGRLDTQATTSTTTTTIKPICPCPFNECKGYVRDNDYKCCICEKEICKKCYININKDEEHTCKKEDIETVEQILKESKPCPTCGTRISKTEGCDQMFCIMCDTAFSWNTGAIDKGRIHNPEYYRKLREKNIEIPREQGDNPCANRNIRDGYVLLSTYVRNAVLDNKIAKYIGCINTRILDKLTSLITIVNHNFEGIESITRNTNGHNTLPLKINYLKNKIDEDKFITEIHEDHTRKVFCNEIVQEMQDNCNTLEFLLFKCNEYIDSYVRCITHNPDNYNKYDLMRFCYDQYLKEVFKLISTGFDFLQVSKVNVNKIVTSYYKYITMHYKDYLFRFEEIRFWSDKEIEPIDDQVLKYISYIKDEFSTNSIEVIDLSDEPIPITNIYEIHDDLDDIEDIYEYINENV